MNLPSPFATRHIVLTGSRQDRQRADAGRQHDRALVLGGGGSAGNAWLIGVIAGLFDAGLDVTGADLIIGTSSGSTTAAQITSAHATGLFASTIAAVPPPRSASSGSRSGHVSTGPVVNHIARTSAIIAASANPADMRRRLGASALALDTAPDGSGQAAWRAIVAARLSSQEWSQQAMLITAVNAETGEPVVFDRHSGIDLVDAIAASTSSGAPYRIGDDWYIDGAYRRSTENADLAAGYGRVLVLSPLGGRSRAPVAWGMHLTAQIEELTASGSQVEAVFPENDAGDMFGARAMDFSLRAPAAQAGYNQGIALAGRLKEFWR